jgi:hypothetical protein
MKDTPQHIDRERNAVPLSFAELKRNRLFAGLCVECGSSLGPKGKIGMRKRFCSGKCKQKAYRIRKISEKLERDFLAAEQRYLSPAECNRTVGRRPEKNDGRKSP